MPLSDEAHTLLRLTALLYITFTGLLILAYHKLPSRLAHNIINILLALASLVEFVAIVVIVVVNAVA